MTRSPGTPTDSEVVEIEFKHDREIFVARVGEPIRQIAEITGRGKNEKTVPMHRTFAARTVLILEGSPWTIVTDGGGQSEWAPQVMVQGSPRRVVRK